MSMKNTIAGIASFGGQAGFIGKVADDEFGRIFTHDQAFRDDHPPVGIAAGLALVGGVAALAPSASAAFTAPAVTSAPQAPLTADAPSRPPSRSAMRRSAWRATSTRSSPTPTTACVRSA